MDKLEKVIRGLEWCMNEKHDCYREKGCPYENEGEDIGCKYALHRDALALLKAQEPVEPIIDTHWETPSVYDNDVKVTEYKCGACGAEIDKWDKYCPNCGRAVKWE